MVSFYGGMCTLNCMYKGFLTDSELFTTQSEMHKKILN